MEQNGAAWASSAAITWSVGLARCVALLRLSIASSVLAQGKKRGRRAFGDLACVCYNSSVSANSVAIGKRVREARETAQLSQAELGRRVGLAQRTISAIESGSIEVSVEKVRAIAKATEHEISFFVTDSRGRKPSIAEAVRAQYPELDEAAVRQIEALAAFLYDQYVLKNTRSSDRPGE